MTPFAVHNSAAAIGLIYYSSLSAAGSVVANPMGMMYCLVSTVLESTDGTTEVTLKDSGAHVIYATMGTLSIYFGPYGPCFNGPITLSASARATIGWYYSQ